MKADGSGGRRCVDGCDVSSPEKKESSSEPERRPIVGVRVAARGAMTGGDWTTRPLVSGAGDCDDNGEGLGIGLLNGV